MQFRDLLLVFTAMFSFVLTPLSMAESAEDLFLQGDKAFEQGNYTQAAKLFEQACNGGEAEACTALAVLYEQGQGVKQDYAKSAKLFEQACNGGEAQACYALGVLYHSATGKEQDFFTAKKYYGKACNLGYQKTCDEYKKMNIQ